MAYKNQLHSCNIPNELSIRSDPGHSYYRPPHDAHLLGRSPMDEGKDGKRKKSDDRLHFVIKG